MTGDVMHGRLLPKKNHFRYGIYYLALPLSKMDSIAIPYNKLGLMTLYDRDHGYGSKGTLQSWARSILGAYNIHLDGEIVLVCMPRILGYVFNPVSFWLCYDRAENLKAVLCEVRNTFGEKHTYLCVHDDGRTIASDDTMTSQKLFHVSPFLKREGHYEFVFDSSHSHFKVRIDYFNEQGQKQLITSLAGVYRDMTKQACRSIFWKYPMVTFKAISLIHYQALRLLMKGIRYIPKPVQKEQKVSTTGNLTKM